MSAATTVETLPTTGTWELDSAHSTVTFSVRHHAIASFRASTRPSSCPWPAESP